MDRSVKQPETGIDEALVPLFGGAGVVGVIEGAGLSLRMAELIGGPDQEVTWHPVDLSLRLWLTHDLVWSGQATASAVFLGVGVLGSVAGAAVTWRYLRTQPWKRSAGKRKREEIDDQARYMGRGKRIASLQKPAVEATAKRLKVQLPKGIPPGVPIGETIFGTPQMLYGTYEDLHLDIWGPRQGKSTSRVIPAIMQAPGAVVSTSNKRDVVDATRKHRSEIGEVWKFDPQGVAADDDSNEPTWYWDPIAWIRDGGSLAGQEQRAAELSGHFEAQEAEAVRDSFFAPKAANLLTSLFLAAMVGDKPITEVYSWVTRPTYDLPAQLLATNPNFRKYAVALVSEYEAPPKQRDGIFATAEKLITCLKYASIEAWVTPPRNGEPRRRFDVAQFARSTDTLYALSKESKGNAGALVTALTAAVCDAAAERGIRSPGGRLPVPMLAVLDEAANIVRWADLPKLYSHFGSRGIIVMTILQSWGQGVRCWGAEGMETLWSAANIRVLGSGVDHAAFLRDRSELIGDHYELNTSVSKSRGGGASQSTSRVPVRTLTPADLAAMPRGRIVVFTSGNPPTLLRTVAWYEQPYAEKIRASLAIYEPKPSGDEIEVAKPHLHLVPDVEEDQSA